jgi:hypothetical protein
MTRVLAVVSALLAVALAQDVPAPAGQVQLYVSPQGNDSWSGALAEPNGAKTDGPFATPTRARDEIVRLKAEGKLRAGALISFRAGLYELSEALLITPACSGAEGAPVIFAAYPGETPVLSGGRRIRAWKQAAGRWEASLPDVAAGQWSFTQFFVDDARRYRPVLPADGYFFVREQLPASPGLPARRYDRFRCGEGELRADWANPGDIEVHAFHCWSTSRLPLKSVSGREVTLAASTFRSLERGTRYRVENVAEALTQPGQWYLDRPSGTLRYLPLPGEDPAAVLAVAPRLASLVEIRGEAAAGQSVSHVEFRGLTLAYANWVTPPQGNCISQAEYSMPAAVSAVGAQDCAFVRCRFTHLGGYALELGRACKRNRVETCEFTDLGGGGVKIGEGVTHQDDALVASHNTVRDSLFAHGGRLHPAAVCVWVGRSHSNVLEHNELFDFYYSGFSVGWTWGYEPGPARDNLIAFNRISWMPQEVLGDQAGIYTLGAQPGTVIRGNVIHDQFGVPWACGIYLDEGSSEVRVEDNLVYRVTTHAFHCNYGRDNLARNNIFAYGMGGHIGRCRGEEHLTYTVEQNLIVWDEGPLLATHAWDKGLYAFDRNLYWNPVEPAFRFASWTWDEWRAKGQDTHSLIADPLFVDPKQGDFTLKPGSPAEKIGFKPFDYSQAGRLTKSGPALVLAPRAFPPAPRLPPELPPEPILDDFETVPVGGKSALATTQEDEKAGKARVTEETAATGKRCLKIEDAPGQKAYYNPHLYYRPLLGAGSARVQVDLRWETGAQFVGEWRDYKVTGAEFANGPAFQVDTDGTLTAGGQTLATLPAGQWVHLQMSAKLGAQADGTFAITLRLPEGKVIERPDLAYGSAFKRFDWLGFVSTKDGAGVFYLDNLSVEPVATAPR